jgi:colanic acid biosynthesis glycosyl transferase WcaI
MRVLYLSQYYPPEIGATQTRAIEMARGLVRAGHQVTMIAEFPNHPTGVIPAEYRGKFMTRSQEEGLEVIRVWIKAAPVKTFRTRMAFYLSYMTMATLAGLFLAKGHYDVLMASSPPLFVGGAALAISYLRRLPLVFEIRDLWPESAVAMGQLRNPQAVRLAEILEEWCYRRARRIVVVTEGIRRRLIERRIPAAKLSLITNGANTDIFTPGLPDETLRKRLGIAPEAFVTIFVGLHGLICGMDAILEAAEILRAEGIDESRLLFLLVGDGPVKGRLQAVAKEKELANVRFLEAQPEKDLPAFIRMADVGLATSSKLEITKGSLPVKMFSYMACARPVLLAVDGEAKDLLEEAEAGLYSPPEDGPALAEAVKKMQADPQLCHSMGENGRRYVVEHYSRQALAAKLMRLLEEAAAK